MPIGLTNVLKKLAPRPKSWKRAIPRARVANGYNSARYKLVTKSVDQLETRKLTNEECVGERVVSHVVAGRVCEHPEDDKTTDCRALGGQVSFLCDRPAMERES